MVADGCTKRPDLEMEPKYLTKTNVYDKTKYCKKHQNNK